MMTERDAGETVLNHMRDQVRQWREVSDQRAVFLSCYSMMTANMLAAVDRREFSDNAWTKNFISRFADYYFEALIAYDCQSAATPRVWRVAHDTCRQQNVWPIQTLLLGINAHINYDLVLAVEELLRPEWSELSSARRAERLADYLYVNDIIARTIDEVQDTVLEPEMPSMRLIDIAFGPADEWLLSRLLRRWRGQVWHDAMRLVATTGAQPRDRAIHEIETTALSRARAISHPNRLFSRRGLI